MLVLKAYLQLIRFDFYRSRNNFTALRDKVLNCPLRRPVRPADSIADICSAIDLACTWYWKPVLCLQRSAATACLLKHHGVCAQMIIGAQHMPFRAHAWVEVGGHVVNDKPYAPEMYAILDRW